MSDLISREEAMALIRAESDISMQNWKEHDDECSYGEMCAHDRDVDILQSLPSAQPRWIPCSERLPEKSGLYLVTMPFDRLMPVHSRYFNKRGEQSFWSGHPMNEVVAWMPLPTQWEGGQDE